MPEETLEKQKTRKRSIPHLLVSDTVSQNIPYLNQAIGKPTYFALQAILLMLVCFLY